MQPGGKDLVSYRTLEKVDWLLAAVVPLAEAYAPIQAAAHRLWLITLAVIAVVAPVVWALAWKTLNPLTRLRDDVDKFRGDDSHPVALTQDRSDEIGELSRSFTRLLQERASAAASQRAAEQHLRCV